jgi:lambda repressor-like predicted transcriptional regulator
MSEHKPTHGHSSTTLGRHAGIHLARPESDIRVMVRRPKFIATRTRKVLADNVRSRMEERFKNEPDMVRALSEQSGVSRSTVQRVLNADMIGASIDTLTQLANALHCDPYELLLPERFPNHHHRRFDNQKPNLEL